MYPGLGLLGQRASLFNEEYIFIVAVSSFHCHFRWLPLGCLWVAHICITSFCPHQTPGMLAEQIFLANIITTLTWNSHLQGFKVQVQRGSKRLERRGKRRTLRLQNCFLWEMAAEFQKVSHTFGSEPAGSCQQGRGWQEREGAQLGSWQAKRALQVLCYIVPPLFLF